MRSQKTTPPKFTLVWGPFLCSHYLDDSNPFYTSCGLRVQRAIAQASPLMLALYRAFVGGLLFTLHLRIQDEPVCTLGPISEILETDTDYDYAVEPMAKQVKRDIPDDGRLCVFGACASD